MGKKIEDEASNLHKNQPNIVEIDENRESKQIPEPKEEIDEVEEGKGVVRKPVTQSNLAGGQCALKTAKTDVQVIL